MDKHVEHYFCEGAEFSKVRALHLEKGEPFEELRSVAPDLPKGWWELARIGVDDRVEFVRSYWQSVLPYTPHIDHRLGHFFSKLDDIGIYLVQKRDIDPFVAVMVFSEADDAGFFCGMPPADAMVRARLHQEFPNHPLPADYMAFLKVHDGFYKAGDTGVIPTARLKDVREEFWRLLADRDPLPHQANPNEPIHPQALVPFYQSYGMDSFQCFYADWYPQQEMGNVYYSGIDHTLSDYTRVGSGQRSLAFPTFLDWLAFYLELPAT